MCSIVLFLPSPPDIDNYHNMEVVQVHLPCEDNLMYNSKININH